MHVPILVQPIEGGRFRARAAEPFGISAEGQNAAEATQILTKQIETCIQNGAAISVIEIANGSAPAMPHFDFSPLPDDDWFFRTLQEAIAENRTRDETGA